MRYKPSFKPTFLEENDFASKYVILEEELKKYANVGKLESFDGKNLSYEYYLAENAKASLVIVHGFTEFIRKYREMCKFFLDMGFNVFVFELRGHGFSDRETDGFSKAHVSSFDAYVKDLDCVIENLVIPNGECPIYLFSHSLGGAISGLYMQSFPEKIAKSVMSAPMIQPEMRKIPRKFMKAVLLKDAKKYGLDVPFRGAHKFNENALFEISADQSIARFKMNMETRISDVHYQNSEITNGWLIEAINVRDILLSNKNRNIKTKILIFSAGKDTVVLNKPQIKYLKYLNDAKLISIPEAKHNILNGSEFILQKFYGEMREFLEK